MASARLKRAYDHEVRWATLGEKLADASRASPFFFAQCLQSNERIVTMRDRGKDCLQQPNLSCFCELLTGPSRALAGRRLQQRVLNTVVERITNQLGRSGHMQLLLDASLVGAHRLH